MKKVVRLTEDDLTRVIKRVVSEQTTPNVKDDKAELIKVLRNKLNSMEGNNKFDAMGVAQVIYNNCAHFMNKTDIFSGRQGNAQLTKAPFAPEK
jgi:hypothetical protein